MIKNKIFIKKIISHIPFLNKLVRKIYSRFQNVTYFIPLNEDLDVSLISKKKSYRLNLKNFNNCKDKYKYFLSFKNKSILNYSENKLKILINLIQNNNADIVYDGDDYFYTEITSKNVLELYLKKYSLEKYPHKFFYIKENLIIKNIGSQHRNYNFNGTFALPSGGLTIGDGGPVVNRLRYIPDLTDKSFLDIGTEEGYAVFDAVKKGAKFAKGLNIEETKEYDFFPEHSRPTNITTRRRDEINKTQEFLLKEHKLEKSDKIKFEYNNIYKLKDEKFDFIFCFGVLYHLKNPYLALENLYNSTRETLIIETQGIKNENYLNAKISMEDGLVKHSSNALAYLLKRVGFKKVEILFEAYDNGTLVETYDNATNIQNIVLKAEK
jgi:SAM-dependent methyltransferase